MEHQTEIGIFIGFGCLTMLILAMVIILFYQNYRAKILQKEKKIGLMEQEKQIEAFKAAVEAEEKQKERIANNLHDEIIPLLVVIGQNVEKHVRNYNTNKFNPADLKKDFEIVDESIAAIRSVALELIPQVLITFGLPKALWSHIKQLSNDISKAEFDNQTDFEKDMPFSKSDQVNIYRICLEILNNLQKHAHYQYLKVTANNDAKNFVIEFRHDGKGVSNEEIALFTETSVGLGLRSLQSRLLILNASIHYEIEPDTATIHLSIPFSA